MSAPPSTIYAGSLGLESWAGVYSNRTAAVCTSLYGGSDVSPVGPSACAAACTTFFNITLYSPGAITVFLPDVPNCTCTGTDMLFMNTATVTVDGTASFTASVDGTSPTTFSISNAARALGDGTLQTVDAYQVTMTVLDDNTTCSVTFGRDSLNDVPANAADWNPAWLQSAVADYVP
ncbi:hypothetical protein HK101_009209, partial [Irineochytrium annulatum]